MAVSTPAELDRTKIKQLIELLTPMTGRYIRDKTGLFQAAGRKDVNGAA